MNGFCSTDKMLGGKIKRFRKRNRMTQNDFSRLVGVSQRDLSFYENGHRRIPAGLIVNINRAFAVDLKWLLSAE